ncbi:VanZ family protein [Streptomyces pinistramenti]|uniref:VanZ family protein n=1 Tax=Streptomyces pinistramenti TaxID=2884812 RepID=UPI001D0892ED|nr:VanZ family protein [Streptomyces pinistramenti]MCB5907419.1 VanZ family protein [Streptomyces pinistramenti]
MTGAYILPLSTAALLFPVLAVLMSVPMAIVLYRRHGIMTRWRTLSLYGCVYYGISALCLVVVPLPGPTVDVCKAFPSFGKPQFMPGSFIEDMWKEAHHHVSFGALILHNPAFWQTVFNLLLLLPLGVFIRLHVRRGLLAATAAGLLVSLFFELTQFTGLWGIYPCPYRLFAVDDLLANAAGASIGWALAGPLARLLPDLDSLDDRAMAAYDMVPFGRRLVALVVDMTGLVVLAVPATFAVHVVSDARQALLTPVFVLALWFVLLPWLTGATPGKHALLLRLTGPDGARPGLGSLALRAAVLAAPLGVTALFLAAVAARTGNPMSRGLAGLLAVAVLGCGAAVVCLALYAWGVRDARRHPERLGRHEVWSGVTNEALPHLRARKRNAPGADDTQPQTERARSAP